MKYEWTLITNNHGKTGDDIGDDTDNDTLIGVGDGVSIGFGDGVDIGFGDGSVAIAIWEVVVPTVTAAVATARSIFSCGRGRRAHIYWRRRGLLIDCIG